MKWIRRCRVGSVGRSQAAWASWNLSYEFRGGVTHCPGYGRPFSLALRRDGREVVGKPLRCSALSPRGNSQSRRPHRAFFGNVTINVAASPLTAFYHLSEDHDRPKGHDERWPGDEIARWGLCTWCKLLQPVLFLHLDWGVDQANSHPI